MNLSVSLGGWCGRLLHHARHSYYDWHQAPRRKMCKECVWTSPIWMQNEAENITRNQLGHYKWYQSLQQVVIWSRSEVLGWVHIETLLGRSHVGMYYRYRTILGYIPKRRARGA